MKKLYNGVVAGIIMSVAILGETTVWSQTENTNGQPAIANTGVLISSNSENDERHHDANHICPSEYLNQNFITENGLEHLLFDDAFARQNTSSEPSTSRSVRRVPVVFHIVYNNSTQNVSDQTILQLVENLNQDFRKNSNLIFSIRPEFSSLAADTEIEFCLASVDPNGNYTKGITRTATSISFFNPYQTQANANIGGANTMKTSEFGNASWNPSEYINIWVCNINNDANSGLAGYAYSPIGLEIAGLPSASIDGIVLDYNLGVQNGASRTVSHEMVHYLGLKHTWGSANGTCNSGDDGFFDTPSVKGAFIQFHGNCSSGSNALSCESAPWQFENLMDYSECISMFTHQQANYMNAVLSGSRSSLLNSAETHCTSNTNTALTASFSGCVNASSGSIVTLTSENQSSGAQKSWSISPSGGWLFVNGTNNTSENPEVLFTNPGNYAVSLTVSEGSNTLSHQVNDCVFISSFSSVEENTSNSVFQVYPNSSNGVFNLTLPGSENRIRVYNTLGINIIQTISNSTSQMIDITGFGSGVNYLEVVTPAGYSTERIVLVK